MATATYAVGEEIITPAAGSDVLHHITGGHVRLYKVLPDGRSITLALLGPGDYFSQDRSEHGYGTGFSAEALSEATIETLERAAFERGQPPPERLRDVLASQARQIAALHTLVEQLLARDTGVRLATTLLQLADGFGRPREDGRVLLALPMTHQAIANMIGANRVTVTRKLLELQAGGSVIAEGRGMLSIDPDRLRRVVETE